VEHLLDLQRDFRVTMTGETKPADSSWPENVDVLVAAFDEDGAAIGRTLAFDEDVVERTIEFARRASDSLPPHLRRFEDPQPVADGAPAIERLAALLGRSV
jgi:hypothetical protein